MFHKLVKSLGPMPFGLILTNIEGTEELSSLNRSLRAPLKLFPAPRLIGEGVCVRHVAALFGGSTPGNEGEEDRAGCASGSAPSVKPFGQSSPLAGLPAVSPHHDNGRLGQRTWHF